MFIELSKTVCQILNAIAILLVSSWLLTAQAQQTVEGLTEPTETLLIPAISVADYEAALLTGENIAFKNIAVPDELRPLIAKTFSSNSHDANSTSIDSNSSINPQIIQGINASRNEFPEFTLMLVQQNDEFVPVCGGTLIDNRKVLTAGHCSTSNGPYLFIPNFYSFNDFSNGIPSNRLFNTASRAIHPNFISTSNIIDYDVAVFTLTRSANTAQATLYNGSSSLSGNNGTVIGVGLLDSVTRATPTILQEVAAPIVSNNACQTRWGSSVQITSRVVCAGFTGSVRGACNGDSGGPLWINLSGRRVQAGIVSFGPMNCANNVSLYGGYARISTLESFIRAQAPGAEFSSGGSNGSGSISSGSSSGSSTGSSTSTPPPPPAEPENTPPVVAPIYELLLNE